MDDKFDCLMIDPPWPKTKGGLRSIRPNQGKTLDYKTMSVEEIFALLDRDVFPKAQDNHNVFLWTIDEFLISAEVEMLCRGYRRHARLIWNKMNGIAPAFSVRFSHEYLIWYYKPKFIPVSKDSRGKFMTVFNEASREHSRKPVAAYSMIEALYPDAKKFDVFSREKRPGWHQFGDQTGYFENISEPSGAGW